MTSRYTKLSLEELEAEQAAIECAIQAIRPQRKNRVVKFEFELNDKIADEIIRQTLTRVMEYAIDEMNGRSTHEEDRAYYRSLSEALDIVLDYFREGE